MEELEAYDPPKMQVDLEGCELTSAGGRTLPFEVNALRRDALLRGLDPIEATLSHKERIRAFQADDRARRPWIYDPGSG